ncbi:hypothetical protein IQ249_24765 [Lusitaniella coriacea LEGE 07157]|uniref:Uncharacterized protein n=1 Tax=Lusitaniella coriacea LEGE 07157 TaxID=945747 RepID=A0A8J7E280_9CYAN|nr:hypothetical protein [Lusitaniella coriacea]MBE9119073.1 hypothetical protein [Lusitaniella coriacea LEGE 07157]
MVRLSKKGATFFQRKKVPKQRFPGKNTLKKANEVRRQLPGAADVLPGLESKGRGFYGSPNRPVSPYDCENYPDSLLCGGQPFSAVPIGIEIGVVADGCNLGVNVEGTLGFTKLPPFQLVYRKKKCRKKPHQGRKSIPRKGKVLGFPPVRGIITLFYSKNFTSVLHEYRHSRDYYPFYQMWEEYEGVYDGYQFNTTQAGVADNGSGLYSTYYYGNIVAHGYSIKGTSSISFRALGEPEIPNRPNADYTHTTDLDYELIFSRQHTSESFPGVTDLKVYDEGSIEGGESAVNGIKGDAGQIYKYLLELAERDGGNTNYYTSERDGEEFSIYEENHFWVTDIVVQGVFREKQPIPRAIADSPPPPPPEEEEDDMGCCKSNRRIIKKQKDLNKCLLEIKRELKDFRAEIGWEATEVPLSLLTNKGKQPQQIILNTMYEFLGWQVQALDGILGEFEIPIEIKDAEPNKDGDQTQIVRLPNIAEAIAEIYGLLFNTYYNSEVVLNSSVRTLLEVGSDKQLTVKNNYMLTALIEYLGFRTKEKREKVPFTFDPIGENKKFDQLLRETDLDVSVLEYEPTNKKAESNLQDTLFDLLQSAAIIRAVFAKRVDPDNVNESMKEQLKSIQENLDRLAREDEDWRVWLEKTEIGFADNPKVSNKQYPYGRSYENRPRLRDLTENPAELEND